MKLQPKIALVGNPNSGKSSLFNALTGLNQKVGNYPGVTVDKKTGVSKLDEHTTAEIIDLPGTYSLYPKTADEKVTYEVLLNPNNPLHPNLIVIIADASNLKRNLLFCSQIIDLKIPVVLALSMNDIAKTKGIATDITELERRMNVPVVNINPRKNQGLKQLKKRITETLSAEKTFNKKEDFINLTKIAGDWLSTWMASQNFSSNYAALQTACNYENIDYLDTGTKTKTAQLLKENGFNKAKVQAEEVMQRYQKIADIMKHTTVEKTPLQKAIFTEKLDKILLHPFWGNLVLLFVLFLIFQSIFWLAAYPMDWIDQGFSSLSVWLDGAMNPSWMKDLLINGILAGIGGIVIFVPQIMILFGFITLLEETGYMARISFLTDRIMRSVGLNGRSVMPLISGVACAVPAIMATRTIQNTKEKLITILVTPLMSCSARLPVYTILIALVIPPKKIWFFNLQGLVLMGMYLLGFLMAFVVAYILDKMLKNKERSFFLMELPVYRLPRWKNLGITMIEKAKIFITDAGKVIMIISLLLWVLASYGPGNAMKSIEEKYAKQLVENPENSRQIGIEIKKEKLEQSYAGILGKTIEPMIEPLGYDWKIGIAIITSFAAREVFVGTMSTLYSLEEDERTDTTLMEKMRMARKEDGTVLYTLAAGLSLMVFYAFAMQCMSTLAVVKRETRTWKYPIFQFVYMFFLAYGAAFITYSLFS